MQSMKEITAEPLHPETFAPFGDVLECSEQPTRRFFNESLENTRANAKVNLSIARVLPADNPPFTIKMMERHPYSSQTFIPIKVSRYLVIVAPGNATAPDIDGVCAFVADSYQGITYRCGTWHHSLTVLDEVADMAVLMWCDGSKGDEEFIDLKSPFNVLLPDKFKARVENKI